MYMRKYLSLILFTLFLTSCQNDNFIEEEFHGEWNYYRNVSSTFTNLGDDDFFGTIIFNASNTGFWNNNKGEYNYDIEWYFDETLQTIEILKYDQDQNLELVGNVLFDLSKKNDKTNIMEFREEKEKPLDPGQTYVCFEKIELTRK